MPLANPSRVIVLDEHAAGGRALVACLNRLGFDAVRAESVREACEQIGEAEQGGSVLVLLSSTFESVLMPVVDALLAADPRPHILFTCAKPGGMCPAGSSAPCSEGFGCIRKPEHFTSLDQLAWRLRAALRRGP